MNSANEHNNSENDKIPKFNIPTQMDYAKGMDLLPLDGTQVLREVITDTYVTASNNEDEMVKRIDDAMTILKGKIHGFAGYMSFCYLQLTLFYVMKNYEYCFKSIDNMMKGVEAIEKYVYTRNCDDIFACGIKLTNYAFGEDDSELKNTVKYLHDSWNVAKMIHSKAASFESGYSLIVSEVMLHGYNNQIGLMKRDCDNFRDLIYHIKSYIKNERDSEPLHSEGAEFVNMEDLQKTQTENKE